MDVAVAYFLFFCFVLTVGTCMEVKGGDGGGEGGGGGGGGWLVLVLVAEV